MTRCLDICWGWLRGTTLKTMRVLSYGMLQLGYGRSKRLRRANYQRNSLTLATEMNEEAMLADGFDDALIGADYGQNRAVYSIELMLQILMERDGMSLDEAREYFDFNIGCAYVGELTPLYVWTEEKFELR